VRQAEEVHAWMRTGRNGLTALGGGPIIKGWGSRLPWADPSTRFGASAVEVCPCSPSALTCPCCFCFLQGALSARRPPHAWGVADAERCWSKDDASRQPKSYTLVANRCAATAGVPRSVSFASANADALTDAPTDAPTDAMGK
jgi:hypothetical protein